MREIETAAVGVGAARRRPTSAGQDHRERNRERLTRIQELLDQVQREMREYEAEAGEREREPWQG
jgi:hypothetical protein